MVVWCEEDEQANPASTFGFLGAAYHGTIGYFSPGWPLAYLIATVIFGTGLVIGAFTYVSHPRQLDELLPMVAGNRSASAPQMEEKEFAGRITEMFDCKWDDSSSPPLSVRLTIGQKLNLTSGLVEITYDTGAKVILQGPVMYEVDAIDGGYLAVGKLTATVEKSTEYGGSG